MLLLLALSRDVYSLIEMMLSFSFFFSCQPSLVVCLHLYVCLLWFCKMFHKSCWYFVAVWLPYLKESFFNFFFLICREHTLSCTWSRSWPVAQDHHMLLWWVLMLTLMWPTRVIGANPFSPSCSCKQYFPAPSTFVNTARLTGKKIVEKLTQVSQTQSKMVQILCRSVPCRMIRHLVCSSYFVKVSEFYCCALFGILGVFHAFYCQCKIRPNWLN